MNSRDTAAACSAHHGRRSHSYEERTEYPACYVLRSSTGSLFLRGVSKWGEGARLVFTFYNDVSGTIAMVILVRLSRPSFAVRLLNLFETLVMSPFFHQKYLLAIAR